MASMRDKRSDVRSSVTGLPAFVILQHSCDSVVPLLLLAAALQHTAVDRVGAPSIIPAQSTIGVLVTRIAQTFQIICGIRSITAEEIFRPHTAASPAGRRPAHESAAASGLRDRRARVAEHSSNIVLREEASRSRRRHFSAESRISCHAHFDSPHCRHNRNVVAFGLLAMVGCKSSGDSSSSSPTVSNNAWWNKSRHEHGQHTAPDVSAPAVSGTPTLPSTGRHARRAGQRRGRTSLCEYVELSGGQSVCRRRPGSGHELSADKLSGDRLSIDGLSVVRLSDIELPAGRRRAGKLPAGHFGVSGYRLSGAVDGLSGHASAGKRFDLRFVWQRRCGVARYGRRSAGLWRKQLEQFGGPGRCDANVVQRSGRLELSEHRLPGERLRQCRCGRRDQRLDRPSAERLLRRYASGQCWRNRRLGIHRRFLRRRHERSSRCFRSHVGQHVFERQHGRQHVWQRHEQLRVFRLEPIDVAGRHERRHAADLVLRQRQHGRLGLHTGRHKRLQRRFHIACCDKPGGRPDGQRAEQLDVRRHSGQHSQHGTGFDRWRLVVARQHQLRRRRHPLPRRLTAAQAATAEQRAAVRRPATIAPATPAISRRAARAAHRRRTPPRVRRAATARRRRRATATKGREITSVFPHALFAAHSEFWRIQLRIRPRAVAGFARIQLSSRLRVTSAAAPRGRIAGCAA